MDNFLTLFDLLGELARQRYQAAERSFSTLRLNHSEARLLTLLGQQGGTDTQDALSNLIFVDRSNAGRALKHLELDGHIERHQDADDKRTNLVQITVKGKTTVAEISKIRKEMAHRFFGELNADEAGLIVGLLGKALTNDDHA